MPAAETAESAQSERRPFEADVAKLLHLMVHSVYSDKSVFLRELIANSADACERLRYEAIAAPAAGVTEKSPLPSDDQSHASSVPARREMTSTRSATIKAE